MLPLSVREEWSFRTIVLTDILVSYLLLPPIRQYGVSEIIIIII